MHIYEIPIIYSTKISSLPLESVKRNSKNKKVQGTKVPNRAFGSNLTCYVMYNSTSFLYHFYFKIVFFTLQFTTKQKHYIFKGTFDIISSNP